MSGWEGFEENWGAEGGKRGKQTSSLVVEDTTEVVAIGEDVGLVRKVGATGIDKVDAGETYGFVNIWASFRSSRVPLLTVLFSDGLGTEMLLDGNGIVCPTLDAAILLSLHTRREVT